MVKQGKLPIPVDTLVDIISLNFSMTELGIKCPLVYLQVVSMLLILRLPGQISKGRFKARDNFHGFCACFAVALLEAEPL